MKTIVSTLAILGVSGATSDFGGKGNYGGSSPTFPQSPYFYSEINSMEYDSETDYQSRIVDDYDDMTDSASIMASSLVYEEGWFVSSQALMCSGGENPFLNTHDYNPLDHLDYSEEDFTDEDEDEDDEDDGHSSMLSNASVRRRTKAMADGTISGDQKSQSSSSTPPPSPVYYEQEIRLNKNPAASRAASSLKRTQAILSSSP